VDFVDLWADRFEKDPGRFPARHHQELLVENKKKVSPSIANIDR
jgi:hypothetical protein